MNDGLVSPKAIQEVVICWMKDWHEITEIPKLLELLNITGCLMTTYEMDCQRK